jgi:hypothetical protein
MLLIKKTKKKNRKERKGQDQARTIYFQRFPFEWI